MKDQENRNLFYQTVGKGQLYIQEEPVWTDKTLMSSYYPENASVIQAYVQDACDRLDYEFMTNILISRRLSVYAGKSAEK